MASDRPDEAETSAAGPYEQWPSQRGFDRFYGFLEGETSQWHPELVEDNHHIEPPDRPGYHLTEDIVDRSMQFIRGQQSMAPGKPFFLYLCFGACHAPHHVPREYIDKYMPVFEKGWDQTREDRLARQKAMGLVPADTQLTERPSWIPPWDSLSAEEKKLYARMMEVYAGFAEHTDAQIGRLLAGERADLNPIENPVHRLRALVERPMLGDQRAQLVHEAGPCPVRVVLPADRRELHTKAWSHGRLLLVRLGWRWSQPVPALPADLPAWQHRTARTTHALLYLVLLTMPITGFLYTAMGGFPVPFFGLYDLARLVPENKPVAEGFKLAHLTLQWVLYIVVLLHVAGALQHHLIRKDGILRRMLSPTAPLPEMRR